MAELFENFVDDIGLIPKLKIAREKYLNELRAEVRAEVREEVRVEVREEGIEIGEERLGRLTKALIEQKRLEDLKRSTYDPEYREELYREFHI